MYNNDPLFRPNNPIGFILNNPTIAKVSMAFLKSITIDGTLTAICAGPSKAIGAMVRAFPSYLIRDQHDDPLTALAAGGFKYGLAGESSGAGAVNHLLYHKKVYDVLAPFAGGGTMYGMLVEGGDTILNAYFMNKTIDAELIVGASKTGVMSGLAVNGLLLNAIDCTPKALNFDLIGTSWCIGEAALTIGAIKMVNEIPNDIMDLGFIEEGLFPNVYNMVGADGYCANDICAAH